MNAALQSVQCYLEQRDIRYQIDPESNLARTSFRGNEAVYDFVLTVDDRLFQVFAKPFLLVPEGARSQIGDLCCRMNYGLKMGKWELDFSDGEIRYQAATCLTDSGELSDRTIETVLGATMHALNRYLPAILSCVYGNECPADAVRHVEAT